MSNDCRISYATELVRALYEDFDQNTGGMLHVQLDDENLDDGCFDDSFPDWLIDIHGREPLEVERRIVVVFRGLSETERLEAVLAYREMPADERVRRQQWPHWETGEIPLPKEPERGD